MRELMRRVMHVCGGGNSTPISPARRATRIDPVLALRHA
jgi:hypothetical protein